MTSRKYKRVLTSKSLKSAKNSFVVSVFVMNIVYYVMLLLGAILFVFYGGKEFATSNEIMITFYNRTNANWNYWNYYCRNFRGGNVKCRFIIK